jgi:hypothetical protein
MRGMGSSSTAIVPTRRSFWRREAWWLNGNAPDCCPVVQGSNPASPQPTADCQSPVGLPPGVSLGCGLTSVRRNRGEDYENEPLIHQKTYKEKKINTNRADCLSAISLIALIQIKKQEEFLIETFLQIKPSIMNRDLPNLKWNQRCFRDIKVVSASRLGSQLKLIHKITFP